MALIFSIISLLFQFTILFYEQDTVINISNNISISLLVIKISTYRILAIFICKQAILRFINKNKYVLIKYTPYIKWINFDKSNNNNMDIKVC